MPPMPDEEPQAAEASVAPLATVPLSTPTPEVTPSATSMVEPAPSATSGPASSAASAASSVYSRPSGPVLGPEINRMRRLAQDRALGFEAASAPDVLAYATSAFTPATASPELAHGRFVPIENEAALAGFHAALAELAAGRDPDGKVRILAYGASHTQADLYTGYLRSYLQNRFGDGGQGFVLLGRVNRWYRTLDTSASHRAATVIHARQREGLDNEPLGLFGAAFVGKHANATGEIVTSKHSLNTRFELAYLAQPKGGSFTLSVDGIAVAKLSTRADSMKMAYYAFTAPAGQRRISVRPAGNGPVRWFGVVLESDSPGVVLDTLGISGSRITDQLRWNEQLWADAYRRRAPDLVTFAYGTNETKDTDLSLANYEIQVRAVLARFRRTTPEVSCVLISPFDLTAADRPRLLRIHAAQRRISREFNCGFWDGYAFMGGEGGMRRWNYAKPPLASSDNVHLTRRGYVYTGIALGDALMRAYDAPSAEAAEARRFAGSPAVR